MNVGELYEVKHKWLLPFSTPRFWHDCGPVLYLGKEIIRCKNGIRKVAHVVFVDGEKKLLDQTFLKHLEVVK